MVTFTVTLSEAIAVTGTPNLALNNGGTATYTNGSGNNSLIVSHRVAGRTDRGRSDRDWMALNGGGVGDAAGNAANLRASTSPIAQRNVRESFMHGAW
jgi:large repetitive protein